MIELNRTPGRICMVDGKEFLFFSGYSYLGMNEVKEFKKLVRKGIEKYGVLFPSSRISNTRLKLYEEFENTLSSLTGSEDTVSFSSGLLAGKTIAEILSSYKNFFIAPHSHPAIIIQNDIPTFDEDFKDWANKTTVAINFSNESEFVLVSDSVNIMESMVNDFSFLRNIHSSKKIIFLIDDSHGIGILGKDGEGIISQLPKIANVEYAICYSLSKAFNIVGGAVSCSKKISEQLRAHTNYTGSTAINPTLAYAVLKSKNLYKSQRERLVKNISYIKKNISTSSSLQNAVHLPIFICIETSEEIFHKNGIIISSFSYPTPQSKKINRIIVNALHKSKDLHKLCSVINNFSL